LLVDAEVGERKKDGRFVLDRGSMEAHVLEALAARGMSVCVVAFDPAITPTIEALRRLRPRLVFNLTEWIAGNRRLDSAITSVLEMMDLRYTGTGPEGMHLARDKALAKRIVADVGTAVPGHMVVNGRRISSSTLTFPVIVKPQFGDGSDGIGKSALVRTPRKLQERVATIRRRSDEALLCEEFICGRDLFVALLGNEPKVMPPLELVIGRAGRGAPGFATYHVKNDTAYRRKWRVSYRRAALPDEVLKTIDEASRRIFRALKLRDYARIDYRLTPENRLVFLEANANPDLTPDTFGRNVCFAGVAYPDLISGIVEAALAR
jgi:D-alanine-D-alanine ligase